MVVCDEEEVNSFFRRGHTQIVSSEDRILLFNELNDSRSIINSMPSRKPYRRIQKKRTPNPIPVPIVERKRLTGKRIHCSRPLLKLGIFNHFIRSKPLRLQTFDETNLLAQENEATIEDAMSEMVISLKSDVRDDQTPLKTIPIEECSAQPDRMSLDDPSVSLSSSSSVMMRSFGIDDDQISCFSSASGISVPSSVILL